jgi:hypothetical protein
MSTHDQEGGEEGQAEKCMIADRSDMHAYPSKAVLSHSTDQRLVPELWEIDK